MIAFFSIASFAHAESVVWSSPQPTLYAPRVAEFEDGTGARYLQHPEWFGLTGVVTNVTYHARVIDVASGALVQCGSTVPTATQLRFEFGSHAREDVSWFRTGFWNDSPYGDWSPDAKRAGISCRDEDLVNDGDDGDHLAEFVVRPPEKNVEGLSGLSCASWGSDTTCTMMLGTYTPVFTFAPTVGRFWAYFRSDGPELGGYLYGSGASVSQNGCSRTLQSMGSSPAYEQGVTGNAYFEYFRPAEKAGKNMGDVIRAFLNPDDWSYQVQVPEQTISCPITVKAVPEDPEAHAPALPTLTSGGACVIGQPHSINFVSTDPDNDNLRYGVDWNADGSIDQYVPASGYVSSGSTQSASRTYSIAGFKTVKVLAQDTNGLSSGRATLSFTCADSATVGLNENNNQNTDTNQNNTTAPAAAVLDLRVIPSLVSRGNTTKVNWSATGVSSCTVSGQNGDSWTGISSPIGGNVSKPITGATTYTLSCIDLSGTTLTKFATVRIIPTFQEK